MFPPVRTKIEPPAEPGFRPSSDIPGIEMQPVVVEPPADLFSFLSPFHPDSDHDPLGLLGWIAPGRPPPWRASPCEPGRGAACCTVPGSRATCRPAALPAGTAGLQPERSSFCYPPLPAALELRHERHGGHGWFGHDRKRKVVQPEARDGRRRTVHTMYIEPPATVQ